MMVFSKDAVSVCWKCTDIAAQQCLRIVINPLYACVARVIVVVPCVCMSLVLRLDTYEFTAKRGENL